MKKTTLLLSVSCLALGMANAQDTAKVQVKEAVAVKADSVAAPVANPFTFSGYIDSYYLYNLNNPKSGDNLGQSGTARAFDQRANTFGIGLVQTKFAYAHKKSDVVVDLTFGPNADLGNYGNNPFLSWNSSKVAYPGGAPGYFLGGIAIKQAYFNYKATDKLTFTAGQFGTHIGYEVIDAPVNYNYSLSNLFNNGPFYHIGAKASYAFTDRVALMGGVVNNVDALYDNNKQLGYIGQLFVNPAKGWNVYINYIGSNESNPSPVTGNDTAGWYQLLDLTTGYQITEKFYLGVNAAYGNQNGNYQGASAPVVHDSVSGLDSIMPTNVTREWGGVAVYMNYQFNKYFGLGVRGEYFDNTSGVRYLRNKYSNTGGTDVTSITVTAKITLDEGHFILKPEFRMDTFKKLKYTDPYGLGAAGDIQQFQDSNGNWTKNSQATVGMSLIYVY